MEELSKKPEIDVKELYKIKYDIKEISTDSNLVKYRVSIIVPEDIGRTDEGEIKIDGMKFVTETSYDRYVHPLQYVKNENGYVYFEEEFDLPTRALYNYYFSFYAKGIFIYYKKKHIESYHSISKDDMWKMSVNFKVPEWAQGKMMYHIFVDRFNRGSKEPLKEMPNRSIHKSWNEDITIGGNEKGLWCTDFYGGDLKGITERLDYIKSLGTDIIYLSPVVYSQSNHRYDASDFEQVDPYAGTNEDLKELCDKAHSKGMKIVLDAVFNHTGNDSKYFNEFNTFPDLGAYQSRESKYYPFYRKHYNNGNTYFDFWWGMGNLPVCDGNSKEWQDYIYGEGGIIDKWFALGIDGLRLDVADELTDGFIEGIRRAVKRNKEDGFILGEVWKNPMRQGRSYLEGGKGMDTVMDYLLVNALIRYYKYGDHGFLNHIINEIMREYPEETINSLMNFTSTHDISRIINILGSNEFKYNGEWAWDVKNEDRDYQKKYRLSKEDYELGKKIYISFLWNLAYLPGTLSIFYGDEIGMQGLGNLCNRRSMSWNKADFDILNNVRAIGKIRNNEKFLEKASLDIIDINEKNMSFIRRLGKEEAYVLLSRIGNKEKVQIPKSFDDNKLNYSLYLNESKPDELSEYGGIILKKTL